MSEIAESIQLHCQRCGAIIHVEALDEFVREVSDRLAKFLVCDACSQRPKKYPAAAANWLARSNPNN